jgi:hypothetical protein
VQKKKVVEERKERGKIKNRKLLKLNKRKGI